MLISLPTQQPLSHLGIFHPFKKEQGPPPLQLKRPDPGADGPHRIDHHREERVVELLLSPLSTDVDPREPGTGRCRAQAFGGVQTHIISLV